VIETYGVDPQRVDVIPIAAAPAFRPVSDDKELQRVRHTYGIDSDYILSVGSIQPRKNLVRLVKAYALLRNRLPEAKLPRLVFVGKRAWLYDETLRALDETGIRDAVTLTGYVPQSDLPALYSGALCFVYPSFFEGFGLPPLEAMQCGVPVVIGNRTSLPEVVGDAAVAVDPFDVHAIARAIEDLINQPVLRDELRVKGLARAHLFNWDDTARRTLKVYEQVVATNLHLGQRRAGTAS
jgi:glycosyltransferase involved in cell wall biosynthesis